ncbi:MULTISPECIES: hypothetical protein [Deinococcus]|jgi:hypothetical protein|uniref:Uncharacterized protein n=2 Tax=Deinococcus soli (ex Cha et al. 2016) TaxID=1309411 RepID=A0AAE3XJZ3_9DEIO|nr:MULTISPECIES: hypothetical protein [Deinococcus]MDK2013689.1 hypothetical protein [Deinococcus sp. 43]MDR6220993.1 hypothetical protein [Deinococcus soli (ex Cha et al. 2016)]MDR6331267.1 hypothetical protein [Deinococcus soli (ex Cha et al. 2016)]MDR6754169.1 hypothetical protein [Deinococcus soli (ex Cha et al. 2016)]
MTTKVRLRTKQKVAAKAMIVLAKRQASRFKRASLVDVMMATAAPQGPVPVVALNAHRPPGKAQRQPQTPDLLLSEPYDWGPQGRPAVKPFRYVAEQGWDMGED